MVFWGFLNLVRMYEWTVVTTFAARCPTRDPVLGRGPGQSALVLRTVRGASDRPAGIRGGVSPDGDGSQGSQQPLGKVC